MKLPKVSSVVYRRLGPTIQRAAASLLSVTLLCAICFAHFAGLSINLLPPDRQTKCHCDIFPPLPGGAIDR